MKVATWNVNGIRAREAEVLQWIEETKPGVVCLQEIKATCDQVPLMLCALPGYWSYWHGGPKGYSGVALQVRKDLCPERPAFSHPEFDFESRIVLAHLPQFTVASIYVPNGGKDFAAKMRFLQALETFAESQTATGTPLILCGDLNIARTEIDVHPRERNPQVIGQLPEERGLFERILSHGLHDLGREMDPENEGLFTWWAPWRNLRARNIGWRIDYILASHSLADHAQSCVVQSKTGTSDHAPVVAEFGV
jgi:exodeoxyribonuclease III